MARSSKKKTEKRSTKGYEDIKGVIKLEYSDWTAEKQRVINSTLAYIADHHRHGFKALAETCTSKSVERWVKFIEPFQISDGFSTFAAEIMKLAYNDKTHSYVAKISFKAYDTSNGFERYYEHTDYECEYSGDSPETLANVVSSLAGDLEEVAYGGYNHILKTWPTCDLTDR